MRQPLVSAATGVVAVLSFSSMVMGQESTSHNTGDVSWMLTSSALVLFMTAPGLALFYSGLVRRKNVLSVMMQCVFLMGLMTVVWALWGYSLAFGGERSLDRATPTICSCGG